MISGLFSEKDRQDLRRGVWMLNYQIDDLDDLLYFWKLYKIVPRHPFGL